MVVLEDTGGASPRDMAMAQMLNHVSESASAFGGRVIDMGELLMERASGDDAVVGEGEFEQRSGMDVKGLVDAVRVAAEDEGLDVSGQTVDVQMVDEFEGKAGRGGFTRGKRAMVKDFGGEESDFGDTDVWTAEKVLHEAAHSLVFQSGLEERPHGPTWQRVYLSALESTFPDRHAAEAERIPQRYAESEPDEGH